METESKRAIHLCQQVTERLKTERKEDGVGAACLRSGANCCC